MKKWLKFVSPIVGLVLLLLAIVALRKALAAYDYHDIVRALAHIPPAKIALALLLTILSYFTLGLYDCLAAIYARGKLAFSKTTMAGFIAYAFGYMIGLSFLSGTSVRYRLYSSWQLTTPQIGKIVIFCCISVWTGFLGLGGAAFLLSPETVVACVPIGAAVPRYIGMGALVIVCAYILATATFRNSFTVKGVEISLPRPRLAIVQVFTACADLAIAGSVLYVLLPEDSGVSYISFLGIFLVALSTGIVSQIPGGIGVLEVVMIKMLSPTIPADAIMGSLMAFRVIYYLLPFGTAVTLFTAFEAHQGRDFLARSTGIRFLSK